MALQDTQVVEDPVKIFIKDIFSLKSDNANSNYFPFCGKLIRKVDIMGTVTEVRSFDNCHLYRVDDCTGEILCRYDHSKNTNIKEKYEIEELQDQVADRNFQNPSEIGVVLEKLLEESLTKIECITTPLQQGDCVHVQGYVNNFRDEREITAFRLYKVPDIAHEVDRVFEVSNIYSNFYSKFNS